MNINTLVMMRQELLLVLLTLIVVIADLALKPENKRRLFDVTLILFAALTVLGFLPGLRALCLRNVPVYRSYNGNEKHLNIAF